MPARLRQGRHGGHPPFGVSTQRFCVGLGQSGLHIANRLPHGPVCRARVAGTGFAVATGLCGTRTPMPPATFRRGCMTGRLRCTRPTGTSRPCSWNEPGPRWGLPAPDSGCGGLPHSPRQPRAKYPHRYPNVPATAAGTRSCGPVTATRGTLVSLRPPSHPVPLCARLFIGPASPEGCPTCRQAPISMANPMPLTF